MAAPRQRGWTETAVAMLTLTLNGLPVITSGVFTRTVPECANARFR